MGKTTLWHAMYGRLRGDRASACPISESRHRCEEIGRARTRDLLHETESDSPAHREVGRANHQPLGGSPLVHAGSDLPAVAHLGALNDAGPAMQAAPVASEGCAIATSWPP